MLPPGSAIPLSHFPHFQSIECLVPTAHLNLWLQLAVAFSAQTKESDKPEMTEATSSEPAQTRILKDLASSPSITGLPGLVFAPDVDGCILDLRHAGVLRLIVNDPKSTDSKDRFIAALRIGVWFQHCLKIAMRSPHVKRTDSSFYILVRNSVRSEYEIVATHSEYSWRKLKAMIFVFEQAHLRFRKDEVSTQSPDADSSVIDIETAFLKPIDLWVDLNKAVKHAGPRAEAFVQTPGWVANILAEYKNKTGIDACMAPPPSKIPPAVELVEDLWDIRSLKRSRTQDDNDTAIASVNIKEKLATSQAEIAKLERENRDLRYQMLTVRSETAAAVRSLQQKLRDMSTEHGDAQVRIAAFEEEMCAMRLNALIAGMPALETQYRIDRAAKEMLDAQAKANAAEEQLQDAKTTIQARDQELRAAEAIIKARDEELQAANQQRKVAAPSAE
ncbi:hypothetical protein B0T11DRAFT_302648 [Plectosphaerella cucumerina]|uniref:Uncharacterized protein n=1 Tax=Plectosphaerella cucumerina TaxID=40658 RepID=A0A8K0WZM3_9PEZI|nr:hypothetical protein B0T11DRAFT_302648 [Plectosphaerella cucumerina]